MARQANPNASSPSPIPDQNFIEARTASKRTFTAPPSIHRTPVDFTLEKIKVEQDNDVDIQRVISGIQTRKTPDNFTLCNDILFRFIVKGKHSTKSKVPYLPASMINLVLEAFHDRPMSGHFGVQRTL